LTRWLGPARYPIFRDAVFDFIRFFLPIAEVGLAAALAGSGVAYGPTFVFGERIAAGDLIALLPDHRVSDLAIHALYPSARNVSLKTRRFIDHLVQSFGGEPP
jgi:DNA-binding transcriptional LysR family regulator